MLLDFDANTSDRYIEKTFGVPTKELNTGAYLIDIYRGVYANLYVVKHRATRKKVAVSVATRDLDPAISKFVPTPLLWRYEQRTLDKITMDTAMGACSGTVQYVQLVLDLGWSPTCYFGGPGNYLNYNFLLFINGADCDKMLEDKITHFEKLRCNSLEDAAPAVAMFVELEPRKANYKKLFADIANLILWGKIESRKDTQ